MAAPTLMSNAGQSPLPVLSAGGDTLPNKGPCPSSSALSAPLSARPSLMLGGAALLFLVAVLVLWGGLARIDGAVVVPGQVEVERNRHLIQHPIGGQVAELRIREGDRVAAGDLLLRLEDPALAPEIANLTLRRDESLARKSRLEAERDGAEHMVLPKEFSVRLGTDPALGEILAGQEALLDARLRSHHLRLEQSALQEAQLSSQSAALAAQLAALDELTRLLTEDLARQRALLERGLTSEQAQQALRRELAQLAVSRAALLGSIAETAERQAEMALRRSQLEDARREEALAELRELEPLLAGLTEGLRALTLRQQAQEIRAPISGRVHGLTVHAAQTVLRPAEPILSLIPENRPLVITALVPALSIDRVHEQQEVSLRFPGLEFGRAPPLRAKVVRLSGDAFHDDIRGPVYRAELSLLPGEAEKLDALGHQVALRPGMPVEAFLLTGARSPLSYLVSPLSTYFARAFRNG